MALLADSLPFHGGWAASPTKYVFLPRGSSSESETAELGLSGYGLELQAHATAHAQLQQRQELSKASQGEFKPCLPSTGTRLIQPYWGPAQHLADVRVSALIGCEVRPMMHWLCFRLFCAAAGCQFACGTAAAARRIPG